MWSFVLGGELTAPPVIGADCTIFAGAADSKVYAISPDGQKKWEFAAGGAIRGSPAVGQEGTVFFGSTDRKVYAVDAQGSKVWDLNPRLPLTGFSIEGAQLITAEKTFLAGTQEGTLHAIYAGVDLADAFWPMLGQNPQHTSRRPNYLGLAGEVPVRRVAGEVAEFQPQLSISRAFSKVELYEGTNLVAVADTAPFKLTWTNILLGTYQAILRATDTNGCAYVSAPFVIEAVEATETINITVSVDDLDRPVLEFNTASGERYNVQYSSDLRDWKTDSTLLESSAGTVRWADEGPPKTENDPRDVPLRFYRVVRQP